MLTPRLKQIKEKIISKSSWSRTKEENDLLRELEALENFLRKKNQLDELNESLDIVTSVVTGPADKCPCCGK